MSEIGRDDGGGRKIRDSVRRLLDTRPEMGFRLMKDDDRREQRDDRNLKECN